MNSSDFTPYYAVIFTSKLSNSEGYEEMAAEMVRMAKEQDGFMEIDSAREVIGLTVSYWRDLGSIKAWKENLAHLQAQKLGKQKWYESYSVRIAKVEREYRN